ncbi:aldose 1-epimerase family protein [Butyrivibrio sp. INlla14]|uniref:aldose 1-epimerase family protein n=1 Tax=Butyrivibrio sp. INlla14 TaxID=1520808 RepID=UPI0008762F6B|nr:aldose 1-epimerase family protein [Butyrivibrio sp. INlla14]SCY45438.1 Galactose mutarotase [Butyrivibrio sp. INlla14]
MEYIENEFLKIAVSDHGAELSSIYDKKREKELLWQADPAFWNRHAPILFPFVGNVYNDEYRYNGKTYHMSSHGFARDMDFEFAGKTSDSISFKLKATSQTLEKYPFDFELVVTHKLIANSISVIWEVKNCSENEPMFYSIGGHPAFRCPINDNEKRTDYKVKFKDKNELSYVLIIQETREVDHENPTVLPLNDGYLDITEHIFDKDALIFDDNQVREVSLCTPDGKPYITMNCEEFPSFGLWSKPSSEAHYVCLEPWIGRCDNKGFRGELPEKYGVQRLEACSSRTISYKITVD